MDGQTGAAPAPKGIGPMGPPEPHVSIRSVGVVKLMLALATIFVLVLFWLMYTGREMPWWEMRYQHTDSTGYWGPPLRQTILTSVPRVINLHAVTMLTPPLPDLPDGQTPPEAIALMNPLAGSPVAVNYGAEVYRVNCQMCHGKTGHGDGAVGEHYVPPPPDFRAAAVRSLPDGAIYYAITNGILSTPIPEARQFEPREWHEFARELTDHERWEAVTYVQALETGHANTR